MDIETLNNLKNLESLLAKREGDSFAQSNLKNKENPNDTLKDGNLTQFIEQQKLARIKYENRLREEQEEKNKKDGSKLKKSQKLTEKTIQYEKERKIKVASSFVEKVNSDMGDIQRLMGRSLEFIDKNEKNLNASPNVKIKVQRLKRMLAAYYYGLSNSGIKLTEYDYNR